MQDRASERIEFLNLDNGNEPTLYDLSKTGACCFCAQKKENGAIVRVVVNTLALPAKVVYCQNRTSGFRLGLQFTNVSTEQQVTLNDLVDKFSRGVPLTCSIDK